MSTIVVTTAAMSESENTNDTSMPMALIRKPVWFSHRWVMRFVNRPSTGTAAYSGSMMRAVARKSCFKSFPSI